MFTLGDAGVTVTLGDAGRIVTRRYGGVIVWTAGCRGTMIGSAGVAMALSKILARSTMACYWASPKWENGAEGAGLVRASVRACAVIMAALTEDVLGTGQCCGKNALSWRCARIWSLEHRVGSSNSVPGRDLNTSYQPHGGPKCGGRRSSHKLGL